MTDFIQATLNAGLQIALSLNARTPNLYTKHARGAGGDVSIGADLLSEEIFIATLSEFGNIDSEEAGFIDNKKAHTIVIDPLDGSDNFLSQIPYYGASVAMKNTNSASCGNITCHSERSEESQKKQNRDSSVATLPQNDKIGENADSAVDCHDSALYAESRNDEFLDSAKIGIIMNFCNLSAVVSFKGKNYYGNLAQEFSAFTKSTLDSTNSQNLQGGLPRRFYESARNDSFLDSSLRKCSAQNDKVEAENDNLMGFAESRLDSALDCHDSELYAESRNDAFLDSANLAKCGIFEGAYRNPRVCEILHKNNIKFRSLGALALSLGLSERVKFVLFNGKKRHYDTEAGFLIAQNLHKIERENLVLISKDKILFDKISNLLF